MPYSCRTFSKRPTIRTPCLREVDRILRPDGYVVVAGFNAWGWWGVRHYLSRRRFPAGGQRMVSEHRLRDWLQLLDYTVQSASLSPLRGAAVSSAADRQTARTGQGRAKGWRAERRADRMAAPSRPQLSPLASAGQLLPARGPQGSIHPHADSAGVPPPHPAGRRARQSHHAECRVTDVELYTDGACRGNPGPRRVGRAAARQGARSGNSAAANW